MTLFAKVKAKKDHDLLMAGLKAIVDAKNGPTGTLVVPKSIVDDILKNEPTLIKVQGDGTPDAVGNVIVFATSLGIQAITGGALPAANVTASVKSQYVLETGIEIPASRRGAGVRAEVFPFAQMEVEQTFFVPATDARPNPYKSLASTIGSANKRYLTHFPAEKKKGVPHPKAGETTGMDGRKFLIRPRTVEQGEKSNGARVWRIA